MPRDKLISFGILASHGVEPPTRVGGSIVSDCNHFRAVFDTPTRNPSRLRSTPASFADPVFRFVARYRRPYHEHLLAGLTNPLDFGRHWHEPEVGPFRLLVR
jgi:hypothetical protein